AEASARAIKIHLESANLPALLSRSRLLNELNRRLAQTLPGMTVVKFLSISGVLAAFGGLVMLLLSASVVPAALAAVGTGYAPFFLLNTKRNRRSRALNNQLPEAL